MAAGCTRRNPVDAPARSQAELAVKKALPLKPHLGPVILCDMSSPMAVVLTTPNRIDFLGSLHTVDRILRTGLQLDATGGIVRQDGVDVRGLLCARRCAHLTCREQFLHVALVYQLPEAAGGGRVIAALLITDSRAEGPMVQFLEAVNRAVYKQCGTLRSCFARRALTNTAQV